MKLVASTLGSLMLAGCYLHHHVDQEDTEIDSPVCAPAILPDAPRELWAFQTGSESGPEHPVVGARGRVYFVVDADPDLGVSGDTVIALGRDGDLDWTWSDGSRLTQPHESSCDGVRLFSTSYIDREAHVEWVRIDRRGRESARVLMPPDTQTRTALPLGEDVVVVRSTIGSRELRLSRHGPDGSERWAMEREGFSFGAPAANEALIIARRFHGGEPSRTTIEALTHEGAVVWTHDLDGHIQGPIVPSEDSIYLAVSREDGSQTNYAFELDGSIRWTLDFERAGNWQKMATHDGTLILRDRETMRAVDAYTGIELWNVEVHPNFDYAPVFDQDGALLLSGGFTRVEPRTGAVLWEFRGARRTDTGFAFATAATIVGVRRIVFGAHNGEIVMFGD